LETLVLARADGTREGDFQEEWNAYGNGESLTVWFVDVDVDGMHLSGILYSVEEPREGAAKATMVGSVVRTAGEESKVCRDWIKRAALERGSGFRAEWGNLNAY
jgi:hypothetical protein